MRLASLTWASDVALLLEAAKETKIELAAWAVSDLNEGNIEDCISSLNMAEAILLHPCEQDCLFDRVFEKIDKNIPIISFGLNPSLRSLSNVSAKNTTAVNAYVVYGGPENIANMIRYIGKEVLGYDYEYELPKENLWQGLYHPDADGAFATVDDFLQWYGRRHSCRVGILLLQDLLGQWRPGNCRQLHPGDGEGCRCAAGFLLWSGR